MKRLMMAWGLAALLVAGGCDSDDGNATDTTATNTNSGDTANNDVVTGNVQPIPTGVDTNVNVTAPTPAAGCNPAEIDGADYGTLKYPWGGFTHQDGTVFTCNSCPGGLPQIQGTFSAIGLSKRNGDPCEERTGQCEFNPDTPLTSDLIEVLAVDGNTFYQHYKDVRNGYEYILRGYYFCTQPPENTAKRVVWVTTEVEQQPTGDAIPVGEAQVSDPLLDAQDVSGVIQTYWFTEASLTASESVESTYCRFGTIIDGKTCRNRFED